MRHVYTPIFKEFTTSSMWAKSSDTRIVWLYMMLHADPEGYLPGTAPGLAIAANVSLEATRQALEVFISPDPDSNTQEFEGRRLEKVPHGWRILNFEYWRRLAQHEAEKARKRRWINTKRGKQLPLPFPPEFLPPDVDDASTGVDGSELLDASKSKSKLFSSSSSSTAREPEAVESRSLVLKELPADMELPEELEAEARAAGVEDPKRWFDKLKEGPIGGDRGVLAHQLDTYLRRLIGSWRTWEETERAKTAQRQAQAASPRRFGESPLPVDPFEPDASQRAFAKKHGLDLGALLKGVLADHPQPSQNLSRRAVLGERLTVAAKQKRAGVAATGKLTLDQAAMWGSVPPGGAIPEVA
jgi:hypothetical protein